MYADPPWLLHLADALEGPSHTGGIVGLDVAELTFMDSTGINALIHAVHQLGERGRVVMFRPRPAVQRVIEICGLQDTIQISHDHAPGSADRADH